MNGPPASPPVVCGVDASAEAATAVRVAGRIAALLDRPLTLVHAAPKPWVSERPFGDYTVRLEQQAAFESAGYVRTLLGPLEVAEPVSVDRIVEWSNVPDDALRSVARRLAAELIVVGSHGQSAIEHALVPGSTSAGLARNAPVPVVLVPSAMRETDVPLPGGALVCGVDGSELSVAAARTAGRLAGRLGVPLVLVNVATSSGAAWDDGKVTAAVAEAAPEVELRTERSRGTVAQELVAASARHEAGLIAVGSRGRGALKSVLLGSVTSMLIRVSDRPVLVVSRSAVDVGVPA
jgi:nucleotide-binding universal stress UspA family protein